MNHLFKAGTIDASKCIHCKRTADMHSCDICGAEGISVELKYGNMLMCQPCIIKEDQLYKESQKPENIAARIESATAEIKQAASINDVLRDSRLTDDGIAVRTDIFNAATVAIVDLKKSIDSDDTIQNKPYALAEELKRRFEHFKNVIFEMQQSIVEAGNEQKAIQVYLNQLANTLRAEEREKLKISDLNYKPNPVKSATPKAIKTTGTQKKTKLNKVELRNAAKELGVSEFTLQMLIVSKGYTVEQAAAKIRETMGKD